MTINEATGIILDLDGTLTLTHQLHFEAYALTLEENGIKYRKADDEKKYSGEGSEKLFPLVFKNNGIELSKKKLQELIVRKREIYQELIENKPILPVPGAKNFIEEMKRQKKKMIIATGNRREPSNYILEKVGFKEYFPKIISSDDVKETKPSPEVFLIAFSILQLKAKECIIFEDSIFGIAAAKTSGASCIGLSTNKSKKELEQAGANEVFKNFTQITNYNKKINNS